MTSPVNMQLVNRAAAAVQRRAFAEAEELCRQVLAQFGEDANALMLLGVIRIEADDHRGAIAFFERARAAMPAHIHVLVNLGAAYRTTGRLHEARIVLERALEIDRRFAIAHNNLGNVLLDLGDKAGAKREYERACVAQPTYAEPIAGLARLAEEEHRLDDARRLSERALSLAPGQLLAAMTRARVAYRMGEVEKAASQLEALLRAPGLKSTNRVVCEGYLGDALDKLARFDAAFAAFSRANELQHALYAPIFAQADGPMSPASAGRLKAFVERIDPSTWRAAPPAAKVPVFLVGFPRSGTTLLDQILASHPEITTLEERDALVDAASTLIRPDGDFDFWATLGEEEIERLRSLYWRQVEAGLKGAPMKRVFVDKLPLNALLLPVICRVFPTAKIVLALRDPRDVVLSCYQQQFGMSLAMFQLLKLDTAAAYYDVVMALVRACRERLKPDLHEVRYEAVVFDFEATVRALLAFLGVAWDEAVRDYAETARQRAVRTPSASQVVMPLYGSAQGKWRNYRRFLAPVLPALEPWVQAFGYEPS
jgi:tetratricopeptide (TPR) repeat protein